MSAISAAKRIALSGGPRVANVFHAGDGNLHPLILCDANNPGDLSAPEAFGTDILRLGVEVGGGSGRASRIYPAPAAPILELG